MLYKHHIPSLKLRQCLAYTGREQGVFRRVFEMHGQHVLCIRWRMPAAQLLQHSPTGGFVPACQSKDSGGLSTSHATSTKFLQQTLFSQGSHVNIVWSAGACLPVDSCSGHEHSGLHVACACMLARLAGVV